MEAKTTITDEAIVNFRTGNCYSKQQFIAKIEKELELIPETATFQDFLVSGIAVLGKMEVSIKSICQSMESLFPHFHPIHEIRIPLFSLNQAVRNGKYRIVQDSPEDKQRPSRPATGNDDVPVFHSHQKEAEYFQKKAELLSQISTKDICEAKQCPCLACLNFPCKRFAWHGAEL